MDSQDSSAPPLHRPQSQQHLPNNSYLVPNTNNSVTSATTNTVMHHQNSGFSFNSMAAASQKPLDHLQSDSGFSIEPARKKRGRPRKYSPDNSIGLGLSPAPATQISSVMANNGSGGTLSSENPAKRNRGRPPGSVKRQLDALGAPGVGFTPHVITVNAGEDVASKIMAFSQQGPRTVCILSANGAICNVTLRQPMSGGTVTYEGRFEIISLTGSFLLSESNGITSRSGGLTVSLAGSDGRVLGGVVAGMLKAASPVQVVVGSFIADGKRSKSGTSTTQNLHMLNFGGPGIGGESPSLGALSESDEENDDSPRNCGSGPNGHVGEPVENVAMYSAMGMGWPNSINMRPN